MSVCPQVSAQTFGPISTELGIEGFTLTLVSFLSILSTTLLKDLNIVGSISLSTRKRKLSIKFGSNHKIHLLYIFKYLYKARRIRENRYLFQGE
jgi:hypothetical protein